MNKLVWLLLTCLSLDAYSTEYLTIVYDARYDKISGIPKNISVQHYDVSEVSKIETQINRRLVFKGQAKSQSDVEAWAMNKVNKDPEIKALIDKLPLAYDYLTAVDEFGLTKVPAVVYSDGDKNFVVYGETNISKAIQKVNAYRYGTKR